MTHEAAFVEMHTASCRVAWRPKPVRLAVLAALAGVLALFLGTAEAGNVQFSGTEPAVVNGNAAVNASQAGQQPSIRRGREAAVSRTSALLTAQPAQEFAPQPNSLRALMPPVTADQAAAHDSQVARDLPAGINANGMVETIAKLDLKRAQTTSQSVHLQDFEQPKASAIRSTAASITADNGIVTNAPPPGPASIDELARALRYHPDLIYQFVRNNIEIDPVRGIHKGALGAVLDNQGSAADQAQLMVSLLRTSGYDARFVRGVISLSAQQFAEWYGVPTGNVCAILNLMGQTQIPVYSISATQGGTCPGLNAAMTAISIEHVWVKANIDGTWYTFDPSYKPHTLKAGMDLGVAAGYNAAAFLSNATAGATVTPDLVRGLNRTGIRSDLQNAATSLAGWIRKNRPGATLGDIVGGKAIVPFLGGIVRQTQNPLLDTRWATEDWTDIPVGFKPTLRVIYQGIDQTFTSDAIYGKRLTITYNAANQPVLKLDGQVIGVPGSAVAPGADSVITFVVWHNAYSSDFADHAFEQHIKGGSTYLIVNGWGPTGRGLSQSHLRNLETVRAAGNADTSEPVLGASLGVLGAQWISQTTASASINDRLANAYTVQQHQVGIAGFSSGPYVDLPSNMSSPVQMNGDTVLEQAVFDSNGMHLSMLESAAVNQTSGVSAVSTVKLLDMALGQGQTIYSTAGGRYASVILPALVNCQAHLGNFETYLNQGYQLLIPGDCQLTENNWNGVGYFVRGTGDTRLLGSIIDGGLSGGFFTTPTSAPAYNIATINNSQASLNLTTYFGPTLTGGDPIDMVHGAFLYEHRDIRTGYGETPDSLDFQRFYSSGMRDQGGALGKGWTHNYNIRLRTASDGFIGLGDRLALDAVGTIVEHRASLDLLNDQAAPAAKFLSAVIAQRWFGDQLVDNTQIATFGLNSDVFARLPDGSFNAPPGRAALLSVSGDTTYYTNLTGGRYTFIGGKAVRYDQPDGKAIDFTWSGDLLAKVSNSVGRSLTLTYANSRLQGVASPQQTVVYAYDSNDNLVSATDPDGFTTRFEYDQPGRMTKFYRPGFPATPVVTNVYDTLNRVQTQKSAAGNLYQYYFAGYRSEEVGPGGSSRANYIDGEGNLLQVSDPMGNWTLRDYDGHNRLVRETRPEGNRTEYAYDDATCATTASYVRGCTHNVASVSQYPRAGTADPVLTRRFTYHPTFGTVSTATDARGQLTQTAYNSVGLVSSITRPAVNGVSPVTTITWETVTPTGKAAFYRPVRVTEKIDATRSTATAISYAADYTPSTTTEDADGLAVKTVTTFDSEGRLLTVRRDGVAMVTNVYDRRGNVTKTNANLLGSDEVIGYDADSRETSRGVAVAGGAMVTCRRYNAMGDVVRVWGPAMTADVTTCPAETEPTPVTDTTYDDHHRPLRTTRYLGTGEGSNRLTEMTYNADDSVKSIRRAVGTSLVQDYVSYTYNPNGTVAQVTDARGNTTVNLYDGHDRLYRTHYPLEGMPGYGNVNDYEQYTRDANGNVTALRKRDGQTVGQGYDALDRLVTRTFPGGVGNVQYSYDLRGLKTASQYSDGSYTVTNGYDGLGRLTQTTAGGRTLGYTYDAAGNVTDLAWPDGFHVTTRYDTYRRPTQMVEYGSATRSMVKYSYDELNRRTQVEPNNGTLTQITYDAQGRLLGLSHRFAVSAEDWQAGFTRNRLGEIKQADVTTSRAGWWPVPGTSAWTVNALNQYTAVGGKALTHDLNGNLTGDGEWTYGYDLENRLKSASRAGTSATLGYDPEGRLVRTTVNGVETNLLYDGQKLVAEYDAAGQLVRRYAFGPGVDEPLVQYEGADSGSRTWLYGDQQGSIVVQANVKGVTAGGQGYGPFGETEGTLGSRFGYTGQQYLAGLGLYYYKARMYSPVLGRFLQTDPVGTADDLNLYAYVKNNPVNLTDPSGMIAASGFAASTNYPSTAAANVAAQSSTGGAKLDVPAISMPTTAVTNQTVVQIAAGTNSPDYAAKMLGYERDEFGAMIHRMKSHLKLGGADNVRFMENGDVIFRKEIIGNMHDYTR